MLRFPPFIVALASVLIAAGPAASGPRQVSMVDFVQDVWDAGENGLPHPGVTGIHQTRDGYLWITTFAGVVRFDGIRFEPPEVPDARTRVALQDHVRTLLEARDGAMWFTTRREGVWRLKDGAAQQFTTKDGLPHDDVRALVQTKDGVVWFATGSGLGARDTSGRFTTYGTEQGLPHANVVTLFVDRDDTLWAGTGAFGIARFDGTRFQAVPLPMPKELPAVEQAFGIPLRATGAIARDTDGVLWAGTAVGLIRVPEGENTPETLFPGAVGGLTASRQGGLWASTGGGLGHLQATEYRRYTSQDGLLNDGLMAVFEDAEGSLWLGSRIGLARLRPRVIRTHTQRDGVGHDAITAVIEDRQGVIWVGHRNGVSRFADGGWTGLGTDEGLPNRAVRALAESPDGSVWVGTLDGLGRYRAGRMTSYRGESPRNYSVRALAVDAKGDLWISSDDALDRFDGTRIERVLSSEQICNRALPNYVYADSQGTIWVGTNAGVGRVRDGRAECLKDAEVLSRNDVRNIYEDGDGRLWIGSIGGLSRVDAGRLQPLVAPSGPFASAIYSTLDDGAGAFWFSTPIGLFRVDKSKIDRYADTQAGASLHRAFGAADGMDTPVGVGGGQPSAWRGRDGRLWFSTATGVAEVDPSRIELESAKPPVYVERLLADRQRVSLAGKAELPPGTRDVELHFALLSFVAPEQSRYKYRLEGHDRDWVESGSRRVAYYSNLSPGRHRFRVIAADHSGTWNETGATVEFELLPRFYQRRWFAPLVGLLLVGAALGAHRYRTSQLRAREVDLQKRVDETVASLQVLRGLLPICASCRRIREDAGSWRQIEAYVMEHSEATFSHGMCPDCWDKLRQQEPGLPAYGSKDN